MPLDQDRFAEVEWSGVNKEIIQMQMSASLVTLPHLSKTSVINLIKILIAVWFINMKNWKKAKFLTTVEEYIKYSSYKNETQMHPLLIHSTNMYWASTIC